MEQYNTELQLMNKCNNNNKKERKITCVVVDLKRENKDNFHM